MRKLKSQHMNLGLLPLGVALACATVARADYYPIALTPGSFNADVVVERTAPSNFNNYVSATMDGGTNNNGSTFYENGYNPNQPWTGLPVHGSTFTAISNSFHHFTMPSSYVQNNAVMIGNYAGYTTGTLTLTAPTAMSTLSVLASAGNGPVTNNYTIHHAGGGTETGTFYVDDWTAGTNIAWFNNGRVNIDNGNLASLAYTNGTNRRLLFYDLPVTDTVNPITSIDFSYGGGGRAMMIALSAGTAVPDFIPLAVTGFNKDIVVEATAPVVGFTKGATFSMDGGPLNNANTWYELGFNRGQPTHGIPHPGASVSAGSPLHTFTMPASYTVNNVVGMAASAGWSNATITLTAPASYATLSFLASSGNGGQSINGVIHHTSDPDEPFNITVGDWFGGANPVITANGRYQEEVPTFNNEGSGNPRIYFNDFNVAGTSAITSIDLNFLGTGGGTTMIFALAGATTVGGNFNPVAISGYNADGVVEASLPDPNFLYPLTTATTVSMDGGTNNTGNTWYEQGYYPAMPTSGLPPAGSTITSIGLPDHHYTFPGSWTANNAIYVDSAHTNADLAIVTPHSYFALSFLNACANGSVTNAAIMQYADGTTESNFFVGGDWFNGTPFAYSSHGRVNLNNQTINADDGRSGTPNPRLYEAQFLLGNTFGTAVTNIHLQYLGAANPTSGRIVIMAVSGTTNPPPPVIGSINPTTINTIEGRSTNILVTISGGLRPMTFQWQAGPIGAGTFTNITDGGVYSGTTTTNLQITSIGYTNALDYRLAATNASGFAFSGLCTINVISGLPDVFAPTDPISAYQPNGGSSPAAESVDHAIDGVAQKYLNFGVNGGAPFAGPVGFVATPQMGKTIVSVMRLFTANDATERDPADYLIEGSNDGGATWTTISSGSLNLPLGRNGTGAIPLDPLSQFIQEVRFNNTSGYLSYRWSVANVRSDTAANSMQIGEVQLLGTPAPTPPIITREPNPVVTVFAGSSPVFSVGAIGYPPPLSYQWYQGASPIAGATGSSYTKANVQAGDSGTTYSCTVTNVNGVTNSSSASLTVIAAPTASYPVAVLADHPIAYWRLDEPDNGSGNSGATAFDHVGGNNGSYTNVTLQVPGYNPILDSDTAGRFGDFNTANGVQDNFVGGVGSLSFAAPTNNNVEFSVEAWVNGSLGNGVAGAGIVANGYGGGGEQFALDCGGAGAGNPFRFYFRDATIGTPAHNVASTNLSNDGIWHHLVAVVDEANGVEHLYVDGIARASTAFSPLLGVRSQTTPLTIGSRASSAATNEDLQFVGSIDDVAIYNTALSSNQVLNHWFASHPAPEFSVAPTNTTAAEGSTATLYSSAYGPAPLTYQWYDVTAGDPGTPLAGKTAANLSFQNASVTLNGTIYRVVASNPYGSTTSPPTTGAGATLTIVSGPPQILADIPSSELFYAGSTITLSVTVGGTAPFTFQWMKNGNPLSDGGRISGAHTSTLTIVVADATDSGNYQLHVTNGQGAADSTLDAITVESVPDFNGNGLGWTLNGTPSPATFTSPDVLQLTFGAGSTARSAFYNTPLYVGSFYAEVVYQVLTGTNGGGADGVSFCLQNDPRGPTALGGGGGSLGVSGVAPSAEFEINIYPPNSPGAAPGGSYAFHVNGANGGYLTASPVVLDSGDPIKLSFQYDGSTLTATMHDLITSASFSTSAAINLSGLLGGDTAYVGFTGADGGVASTQVVTNFMYIPFPKLSVQKSGGNVVLSWLSSIGGYQLQSNSAVNNAAGWTPVGATITQTGGLNQVTVPSSSAAQYYRLILNLPGN